MVNWHCLGACRPSPNSCIVRRKTLAVDHSYQLDSPASTYQIPLPDARALIAHDRIEFSPLRKTSQPRPGPRPLSAVNRSPHRVGLPKFLCRTNRNPCQRPLLKVLKDSREFRNEDYDSDARIISSTVSFGDA